MVVLFGGLGVDVHAHGHGTAVPVTVVASLLIAVAWFASLAGTGARALGGAPDDDPMRHV